MILRASVPVEPVTDWGLWLDARCHAATRDAGLPGPLVLGVQPADGAFGFDYELMEEVRGTCLRELDHDEPAMLAALGVVAAALPTVHGIKGRGFGPLSVDCLANPWGPVGLHSTWHEYVWLRLSDHVEGCRRAGLLTNAEAERVLGLAAQCPLPDPEPALLHCDLGSHNLFVDGEKLTGILDWEDAVLGEPLFDLALWATFQPRRRHAVILDAYYGERARPADLDLRFWFYFLRVTLAKAVHRVRFGYSDVPGRPTLRGRLLEGLTELERACASS